MVNLKANPFYLKDDDVKWVEDTLASLTLEEKVGQMMHCVFPGSSIEELDELYAKVPFGGVTLRGADSSDVKKLVDHMQAKIKVPALVSGNLEDGGAGVAKDGIHLGSQLAVSATNDKEYAYKLGDLCGSEGCAVGANYNFAPVVDIIYNWRNPIVNTRTYGDNPDKVLEYSLEFLRGTKNHDMAVTIKHFPGDGVDERDQHLLASVNSFSCEKWDETYGKVYKGLIDAGAQSVMVGHILLPAYSKKLVPGIKDEDIKAATVSKEIVTGLLREKLGFNGAIITDSCKMTGLNCSLPSREIPAACINAGCDMFLFGRDICQDYQFLIEDVQNGTISMERLDDAVRRILGLKASINLNKKTKFTLDNPKDVVGCKEHVELAKEVADKSITLVKDTQKLLPISPKTHKRIWLNMLGDVPLCRGGFRAAEKIIAILEKEGFEVDYVDPSKSGVTAATPESVTAGVPTCPTSELKEKYDLILYIGNVVSGGNNTVNRISWIPFGCGQSPAHCWDIPTMFISISSPYHYVDVPMIRTQINCYGASDIILQTVIDKVLGRSEFKGTSPVDPFCGMWGKDN